MLPNFGEIQKGELIPRKSLTLEIVRPVRVVKGKVCITYGDRNDPQLPWELIIIIKYFQTQSINSIRVINTIILNFEVKLFQIIRGV